MPQPTPEEIANLITEDVQGTLGLAEDNGQSEEPGDMRVVKDMALRVRADCKKLVEAARTGNVEAARNILGTLQGEVKQAFIHVNRLANEVGLVEPEHRNDT